MVDMLRTIDSVINQVSEPLVCGLKGCRVVLDGSSPSVDFCSDVHQYQWTSQQAAGRMDDTFRGLGSLAHTGDVRDFDVRYPEVVVSRPQERLDNIASRIAHLQARQRSDNWMWAPLLADLTAEYEWLSEWIRSRTGGGPLAPSAAQYLMHEVGVITPGDWAMVAELEGSVPVDMRMLRTERDIVLGNDVRPPIL